MRSLHFNFFLSSWEAKYGTFHSNFILRGLQSSNYFKLENSKKTASFEFKLTYWRDKEQKRYFKNTASDINNNQLEN
jgi:hypothetical protein